ncbi:hypothetical protein M5D96_011732, partial [Drosophila gunungcola]
VEYIVSDRIGSDWIARWDQLSHKQGIYFFDSQIEALIVSGFVFGCDFVFGAAFEDDVRKSEKRRQQPRLLYSHYSQQPSDIRHRTPWTSDLDGVPKAQSSMPNAHCPMVGAQEPDAPSCTHRNVNVFGNRAQLYAPPLAISHTLSLDVSFALCLWGI